MYLKEILEISAKSGTNLNPMWFVEKEYYLRLTPGRAVRYGFSKQKVGGRYLSLVIYTGLLKRNPLKF